MISIGRGIRWYNNYQDEVDFCIKHGFDFMQIWYKDGDLVIENIPSPKIEYIKNIGFPVIIHAVFDSIDFEIYGDDLLEKVKLLGMSEVIIHPVSEKSPVNQYTQNQLVEQSQVFSEKAKSKGITWYLENNSIVDVFHYKADDVKDVYDNDRYVEQLLDVAHIDSYEHLNELITIKFPKCLHIAGKHFSVPHEHLSLAEGDIDYQTVFSKYLRHFDGRIIFEIDGDDEAIIESKRILLQSLSLANKPN